MFAVFCGCRLNGFIWGRQLWQFADPVIICVICLTNYFSSYSAVWWNCNHRKEQELSSSYDGRSWPK